MITRGFWTMHFLCLFMHTNSSCFYKCAFAMFELFILEVVSRTSRYCAPFSLVRKHFHNYPVQNRNFQAKMWRICLQLLVPSLNPYSWEMQNLLHFKQLVDVWRRVIVSPETLTKEPQEQWRPTKTQNLSEHEMNGESYFLNAFTN